MNNLVKYSLVCSVVLVLGACGHDKLQEQSSIVEDTRLQIEEEKISENVALSDVDSGYISALSHHYVRHGGSPMELVVTYDPKSYRNTAMKAGETVGTLSSDLRNHGVRNIDSSILPIKGQGDEGRLIVSYTAHQASSPKDCDQMMPGLEQRELRDDIDYKMGCSVNSLIARQVSRPSDLLGRGNLDTVTDGRASANIIEAYRTGARNEPLDGEAASDDN